MSIKRLTINGLRGFSAETNIHFAIPDNVTPGSGLTILVGPNNSGKSTIIEAIHLLTSSNDIIPISSRNIKNNGKIKIETEDMSGNIRTIESTDNNGAFIQKKYNNEEIDYWSDNMNTFILSSKRAFASTFHNNIYQNRKNYEKFKTIIPPYSYFENLIEIMKTNNKKNNCYIPYFVQSVDGYGNYEMCPIGLFYESNANIFSEEFDNNKLLVDSVYDIKDKPNKCKDCINQYEMFNLYVDDIIGEEELRKMPSLNNDVVIKHINEIKAKIKKR